MSESSHRVPSAARRRLNGISEIRGFFRDEHRAGLLLRTDRVQPARYRPLGPQFHLRRLLRLLGRWPPAGVQPDTTSRTCSSRAARRSTTTCSAIRRCRRSSPARGGRPKVAMVFFDEETEQICAELGYELILPPDALRRRLDSKIVTTVLGNEAGAPSVPNVLAEVDSWGTLVRVAADAGTRHRPRRADPVRRLWEDHLLRRLGVRLGRPTPTTSSASRRR